jgi:hypothetical protein
VAAACGTNPERKAVRQTFVVPIATAALLMSLLAGCGGGGSSTAGSSTAASATHVCDDISTIQSASNDLKQLDASTASAADVKKAIYTLAVSATALASDASKASAQAQSDLKGPTNKFVSELKSAAEQPVSQQLVTVGTALSQFKSSISQTTGQFKCNQ